MSRIERRAFICNTMQGDLDETVERCASLLTSDDGIRSGCSLPMGLCKSPEDENGLRFARLAQEIAAWDGGAVLRRLLWLTLGRPYRIDGDSKGRQHLLASSYTLSLGMLTSSKVVVERGTAAGRGGIRIPAGRGWKRNRAGEKRRGRSTGPETERKRVGKEGERAADLRAHNALEGFRPHKRTINGAEPDSHPWAYYEGRLRGLDMPLRRELSAADWELAEEQLSRQYLAPVVCSRKLCAAGREPVVRALPGGAILQVRAYVV
ncbi:hypothetical protein KFL_000550070 [Klebsormidium nitens]|uniref:Uncharacterized protein n=1 Tax=Klebsormidium nitens TaxID=105231 RepID=A0A1Y1HVB9_KLENI|nr:hypothetical protein KFL_000550070 [Klebsormidium nitens]|eukprot:GAQ80476.1 hypothetical protein KFL_000550070 [Klebsormidium nitens]